MLGGRDGDWVNNLLQTYCKHARIVAKLERAEINPKKKAAQSGPPSTDAFKACFFPSNDKPFQQIVNFLQKVHLTRPSFQPTYISPKSAKNTVSFF